MCCLLFAFDLGLSHTLLLQTRLNIAKCTQKKKKKKAVFFQANRGRQIAESLQQFPVCDARNILEMIHYRPVFSAGFIQIFGDSPAACSHLQSGQFPSQAAPLWPASEPGAASRCAPISTSPCLQMKIAGLPWEGNEEHFGQATEPGDYLEAPAKVNQVEADFGHGSFAEECVCMF